MDKVKSELITDQYPPTPSEPQKIPEFTIWPISLALGITLSCCGLITSLYLSIVGLIIMGISIAGWIDDMNHE